ncbi:putative HTH-type transcriptional regulator YwbI [Brevibacillus reuszeri]|uniref:HTH-type transcriptional regulator YwbI n=1 Tax=Brevibacillus reuszeri TaxID=54915 RepID=A0A0K9Z0N1_9BACL|nr:LysR family transcriptional regulator [Brevibacillus reuszeri]KNB74514.1 LysR family transcriptional regulator [Brevibacillus reuszeri]MED1856445.1 LysR family transcriptional regulator [Brevibacillus reuszeri]GED67859.1 putative HTH-type transcriptional regulator YwbI [Brevibacillus reuszeri]
MDIRQLHYFVEVARQKSFTKAAQALHVSQPSISKMLKALEEELGVILLDRTERKMELTDAGELVYDHATKVLQLMDSMSSSIAEMRNVQRGRVKMGMMPTVGSFLLPNAIALFKKQYPGIEIEMKEYSAKPLEYQVEQGKIDVGLTVLPVDTSKFTAVPLVSEDLVAIVYQEHWLASKDEVRLDALKEEAFILFTEEYAIHDVVKQACMRSGFEPRVAYMSSLWDFVGEMVATQQGISLVPRSIVRRLNNSNLHTVNISSPVIDWQYALIYRKEGYLSHAVRAFIAFIDKQLSP